MTATPPVPTSRAPTSPHSVDPRTPPPDPWLGGGSHEGPRYADQQNSATSSTPSCCCLLTCTLLRWWALSSAVSMGPTLSSGSCCCSPPRRMAAPHVNPHTHRQTSTHDRHNLLLTRGPYSTRAISPPVRGPASPSCRLTRPSAATMGVATCYSQASKVRPSSVHLPGIFLYSSGSPSSLSSVVRHRTGSKQGRARSGRPASSAGPRPASLVSASRSCSACSSCGGPG